MTTRTVFWRSALVAAALAFAVGGCAVEVDPDGDDGGDDGGDPTAQTITIRVTNSASVTLDPEIYISATPVSAEELFTDANKFTAFGVGTLGLLGGNDSDTFEVDCAAARVIGTKGGRFGDDLNNPQGAGQQVILTQDLSIFCGGTLRLTYSGSGSTFNTNFTVSR
jgi:hypothetical protein